MHGALVVLEVAGQCLDKRSCCAMIINWASIRSDAGFHWYEEGSRNLLQEDNNLETPTKNQLPEFYILALTNKKRDRGAGDVDISTANEKRERSGDGKVFTVAWTVSP